MPPELEPTDDGAPEDQDGNQPAPALNLTPEAIRNSPEFQALARQNRSLARSNGRLEASAAEARAAAEEARQAAEAQQQAALEAQLVAVLGDDGVAAWAEIAELSNTDQVAAARRFAELMSTARAQSSATNGPAGDAPPPVEGDMDPASGVPAPPSRGVDGSAPLGAATTAEDQNAVIAALEQSYAAVVSKVQDPVTRNRVTMRERAGAFINYLGAAYLKAGAKPKG